MSAGPSFRDVVRHLNVVGLVGPLFLNAFGMGWAALYLRTMEGTGFEWGVLRSLWASTVVVIVTIAVHDADIKARVANEDGPAFAEEVDPTVAEKVDVPTVPA